MLLEFDPILQWLRLSRICIPWTKLRSFQGILNHYGYFFSEISQLRTALDALLKKDAPFTWSSSVKKLFNDPKLYLLVLLVRPPAHPLRPPPPPKDIVIAADISRYVSGTAISHRFANGTEMAIQHAYRSLANVKSNYGQVEKEAPIIAFLFGSFTATSTTPLHAVDRTKATSYYNWKERKSACLPCKSCTTMSNFAVKLWFREWVLHCVQFRQSWRCHVSSRNNQHQKKIYMVIAAIEIDLTSYSPMQLQSYL